MKAVIPYLLALVLVALTACEPDVEECPEVRNFKLSLGAAFDGTPAEIYTPYTDAWGQELSYEQLRMYLSDISLLKSGGQSIALSEIEFFEISNGRVTREYIVPEGSYDGLIYHIGVPTELNGTSDPDFITSQYGPESPLNVQNGMYWAWQSGYRFLIYEGRIDTLPDDPNNIASLFSIHLGKDTLYTEIQVDMPFSVDKREETNFDITWNLDQNIYNASDTLDFTLQEESTFHGQGLDFAFRFQALLRDAMGHSVD